ncbi:MAG: Hsp20/alpha crystallin family protein [Candidatus Nanohaloarchaea archaeon]
MKRLDRQDQLDDVFDQMQKMFNQFSSFSKDRLDLSNTVPVDIKEEEDQITVTADLPGVQKEDINLKADKDGLEISAEASQEIKEENEKYVRQERSSRRFRRKLRWPTEVDPESVEAKYNDGVLTVEADKDESDDWNIEVK